MQKKSVMPLLAHDALLLVGKISGLFSIIEGTAGAE